MKSVSDRPTTALFVLAFAFVLGGLSNDSVRAESKSTFEQDVRPVLKEYCFDCHGAKKELKADLDLRLRRLILRGGESGPAMVPGKPEESLLIKQLRDGEMPPKGKKVSVEKIELIARWIEAGAPTAGDEPESLAPGEIFIPEEERAFWAYQPIVRPEIPEIEGDRVRTPIDALVADAEEAFQFAPDAGRRTLIRRASLDLTGLPPTKGEIEAFLSDTSRNAYENLLGRLLESPHYGERWARHWLDVAGYADSEGVTSSDAPRSWAWKYRDYVIRALNDDKPFDRFILEQLAGDELVPRPHKNLAPEQIELLTATGFLRMAADGTGSGSDDEASRNQTVADTLKIVSSAFLGLTVGCAQCHDHRYDPIPQRDYYQLRAIFEPALDPKQWRKPSERLISLYTDADHKKAAEVEAEAALALEEKTALQKKYIDQAFVKELERFPEELRDKLAAAHRIPAAERNADQADLLKKYPSANITGGNLYQYNKEAADEVKEFDKRVAKIRENKPYHPYVRALTEPPGSKVETRLFHRGDSRQPVGDPLAPAGLTIAAPPGKRLEIPLGDRNGETSGRRVAFAKWLTGGEHPLVARVLVNRIWMHHFGRGLVGTPGEFGVLGERPTHPKVLDFLAAEFMTNGWSLKDLHRVIMRATVYRQSSVSPWAHASAETYSKWGVQRLDAETIRDRTLAVSGELDATLFGEPVSAAENDAGQFGIDVPRRSLYATARRSQPITLLQSFDAPVMETNCNRRISSNAATQALMVMNGDFHVASARRFAERVSREVGEAANEAKVAHAFELAYGRLAKDSEIRQGVAFLGRQMSHHVEANTKVDQSEAQLSAMTHLCHALISSNEFLYVD
jgi:hypothetical protein